MSDQRELSSADRSEYASQGFLHLRGAFSQAEVDLGLDIVDRALRAHASVDDDPMPYHPSYFDEGSRPDLVRVRNAIAQQRALAYFLDHPLLVSAMTSVLGTALQALGTEIFYRDADPAPHEPWHVDGGPAMQGVRIDPAGLNLQAKAQIFLTDVSEPRSGNFLLLPRSHTWPAPTGAEIEEMNGLQRAGGVPGALTVRARPGDVLLFPYSLWHAVDCNLRAPRKSLILRFGQLWHRPHDYRTQPRKVLDDLSPRLRRMFGDFGPDPHPMDYYKPTDPEKVMESGGDYTSLVPAALLERHGVDAYRPVPASDHASQPVASGGPVPR